jgi:hypothetical protein
MSNIVTTNTTIPALTSESLAKVQAIEYALRQLDQEKVVTEHVIHGGMYARTIRLKAGLVLAGVLIELPTILIVNGDVLMYTGDDTIALQGYQVVPASKGRKQCMVTIADTDLTMVLATNAKTVHDAEEEFTKEADGLVSRLSTSENLIIITGE